MGEPSFRVGDGHRVDDVRQGLIERIVGADLENVFTIFLARLYPFKPHNKASR